MLKITLAFVAISLFANQIQVESACNPLCSNGQPCITVNGVDKCSCATQYVGTSCQLTNPCSSSPCKNGACFPVVQTVNGAQQALFYCQCYSGYYGTDCSIPVSPACSSSPCLNGGACTPTTAGTFTCTCVGPYTGPTCGTYIDYCANVNCKNGGFCVPDTITQSYKCTCLEDYYGPFCEFKVNNCENVLANTTVISQCLNGGTCLDLIGGYVCQCKSGYTGTNCETIIGTTPCANPSVCKSPQICVADSTSSLGYKCVCPVGYFGTNCIPDPCVSDPCISHNCVPVEGGTISVNGCTCPGAASYVCICPGTTPEYAGNC